ncbi:NADH dehydrogenase ubiquinone iron-sulfur protein 4 [Musa troglodytarum]|uniref:NADH dehydrogenase ubiquinone iron-sulfur protein 4 n=1 Tax=Musa troglodytarum TaxID=320322 RepID=A0A9E7ETT8_9LILI|nr:NADH dehydrogenase ubiquinone iron-sulfur protein 4 [Musa troglodytarum]
MAARLRRSFSFLTRVALTRSASLSQTRSLALDALVELRPGEIGIVSGVPREHLQRRVRKRHTPLLKPKSYSDNFKWKGPPKTEEQ